MSDSDDYDAGAIPVITASEAARKRPGMFLGSTGFFGLLNYLVAAFNLHLRGQASTIDCEVSEEGFAMRSDAELRVEEFVEGSIFPFERLTGEGVDGFILAMFSEFLEVDVTSAGLRRQLRYEAGSRVARRSTRSSDSPAARLRFRPDRSIFTVPSVSQANLHSYLARISHLNPGVTLNLTVANSQCTYNSRGMIDLFFHVAQPFQYLHPPIHIVAQQDELNLDLALAFHSWKRDHVWSFVNKGRTVDGGTHEGGLLAAAKELPAIFGMEATVGILAVMALDYSNVAYEGCIKARVENPELETMVKEMILRGAKTWAAENPAEIEHLRRVEEFQFAGIW
ncbi:MAG: hypothetical protein AAF657_34210 [Acidobacteriota bacterium]